VIHARRRARRYLALAVAVALLAGACGGGKKDDGGTAGGNEEVGEPVRGGSVTYGIEAETGDGWCLQESQLAISGILVARTIYDTLTAPNEDGEYVPYLAEDVQPNDDFTEWTITVRDGVKFHDGTDLTATVVKNNLDAYRGAEGDHARSPLLFLFVLDNIDAVTADDAARTVTVTTKVPWVAFPAFLYSSGRLGITAQAQLDNTESCNTDLIGTGPFQLEDWVEGRDFRATKNPDYWQMAPDGEPYPYLDEIVFEPIVESEQRVNALLSGDIDLGHYSGAPDILGLRDEVEGGNARAYESNENAEVSFVQMNVTKPPLDDVRIRRAAALAVDREDYKETINRGEFEAAYGPFGPGSPGYIEDPADTGFPVDQDLEEAERLIAEYEAENGPLRTITYQATPGALTQETALYIQQTLAEIGVEIELQTVQQDALIDNAISGDFDIMGFRNYPGGDPDELYVWFKGQSPVNFGRFDDPEINDLLDQGRSEPDPDTRQQIYQDLTRRMGEQVYSVWANYTTWMIASGPNVYGYDDETMPDLPDEGGRPSLGLAAGHPLHGIWVAE
jgi:peptide/nickel transport system substrate-binding protein